MKAMALLLSSAALLIQSGALAQPRVASVRQVQTQAESVHRQPATPSRVSVSSTGSSAFTMKASTNRDEGVRVRTIRVGGDRWGFGRTTTKQWEPGGDPLVRKTSTQWAWSAGKLGRASGSREFSQKEVGHGASGTALVQTSRSATNKTTPFHQTSTTTAVRAVYTHDDQGYLNTRRDAVSNMRNKSAHTTIASSSHTRGTIDSSSSKVTLTSTSNPYKTTVKVETSGLQH